MERLTKRLDDGQAVMDCESCELREQNCGPLACRNRLRYHLAAYEDTGLKPEEIVAAEDLKHNCKIECLLKKYNELSDMIKELGSIDHLRKLVQAEKDGRLVVLPIPVGEGKMAYGIYDMEPLPVHIVGIECDHLDGLEIYPTGEIVVEADGWEIGESDIGKTVFLTREEAEAALKGGAE